MAKDADAYPDFGLKLLLGDTSGKPYAELVLPILEELAWGSPDPCSPEFDQLPLAQRWVKVVANRLLTGVILDLNPSGALPSSTPAEASARVASALGLTREVIAAIRHRRKVERIGLELIGDTLTEDDKVEQIVNRYARAFKISPSTVYRLGAEAEELREQLMRENEARCAAVLGHDNPKKTD